MPALKQALESKGFVKRNIEFQVAVSRFQNAGGEYGVALAMLNAAYGRGGGQANAANGQNVVATASPGRADQTAGADKAKTNLSARPSHARRGAAAIGSIQSVLTRSLFNMRLPDGRRLGEIRWSECPELAQRYRRFARILVASHNFAIPPDPATTLESILPEKELAAIVAAAERFNDVE